MENPWASNVVNPWLKNSQQSIAEAPTKASSGNPWADTVVNHWLGRQASPPAPKQAQPTEQSMFDTVLNRMIGAESGGRHLGKDGNLLRSPVGAEGITQVMPATGRDPGFGIQPLQNRSEGEFLRFGRDYLSTMLKMFNGDYHKALSGYNAGPGNTQDAIRKARAAGDESKWKDYLPKRSETIPYIDKIMKGLE